MLSNPDLNGAIRNFVSAIADTVKANSPIRMLGVSPFPRWFSPDLKNLQFSNTKKDTSQTLQADSNGIQLFKILQS